jgi:hypothetical protein
LSACLAAAIPALSAAGAPATDTLTDQAAESVDAFASALKQELMAAMQAGGPVQAIEVCHARAPGIARAISRQRGVELSRVSLRTRNPDNAPSDWQAAVLHEFEARREAGENVAALSWQATAETPTGQEFRFMKAIPTGPLCLACHGESIAPEVAARLAELYPDDTATGFSEGDIRGAFVVTRPLD